VLRGGSLQNTDSGLEDRVVTLHYLCICPASFRLYFNLPRTRGLDFWQVDGQNAILALGLNTGYIPGLKDREGAIGIANFVFLE